MSEARRGPPMPEVDADGAFVMTDVQKRQNLNCFSARMANAACANPKTLCLEWSVPDAGVRLLRQLGQDVRTNAKVKTLTAKGGRQ